MGNKKTFLIEYTVVFNNGSNENHTIKAKNCLSELQAKVSLEDYLKKKYSNFKQLIVISCKDNSLSDIFGGFNGFNDIFGFGKK